MSNYIKRAGGTFEKQQFNIAATAEAFRILSDALYSDKIKAVIRELSTNAVDGHIKAGEAAGSTWYVHIPSYSEPWFEVRDQGTGLSHDDVMGLYTTYFGTNKSGELETTGCLGLGSKSPFAKVRSFSVTSYFEGKEHHYIIALNEEGMPEVNYLVEQTKDTDEHSGMKIHMAVASDDIYSYEYRAEVVYKYFPEELRPTILNSRNFEFKPVVEILSGNGWRYIEGTTSPKAIMGNVAYPIDVSKIAGLDDGCASLLQTGLEVHFDNGELNFTPSREHLSYNKSTVKAIKDKLIKVGEEVSEQLELLFDDCPTPWEARCKAWDMFWNPDSKMKFLKNYMKSGSLTWQGENITKTKMDIRDIGVTCDAYKAIKSYRWGSGDSTRVSKNAAWDISPNNDPVFIEVDIKRGSIGRCREYALQHKRTVYLVDCFTPGSKDKFCDIVGLKGDEFIPASSLPKPVHKGGGKGGNGMTAAKSSVFKLHKDCCSEAQYKYWSESEIEVDNTSGVYIEIKRYQCVVPGSSNLETPDAIAALINRLGKVGIKVELYGVRPAEIKAFQKSEDWVELHDYVADSLNYELIQNDMQQHVVDCKQFEDLDNVWTSLVNKTMAADVLNLDNDNAFKTFFKNASFCKLSLGKCKGSSYWTSLANEFNVPLTAVSTHNLENDMKNIAQDYPIVKQLVDSKGSWHSSSVGRDDIEAIVDCISRIDLTTVESYV